MEPEEVQKDANIHNLDKIDLNAEEIKANGNVKTELKDDDDDIDAKMDVDTLHTVDQTELEPCRTDHMIQSESGVSEVTGETSQVSVGSEVTDGTSHATIGSEVTSGTSHASIGSKVTGETSHVSVRSEVTDGTSHASIGSEVTGGTSHVSVGSEVTGRTSHVSVIRSAVTGGTSLVGYSSSEGESDSEDSSSSSSTTDSDSADEPVKEEKREDKGEDPAFIPQPPKTKKELMLEVRMPKTKEKPAHRLLFEMLYVL